MKSSIIAPGQCVIAETDLMKILDTDNTIEAYDILCQLLPPVKSMQINRQVSSHGDIAKNLLDKLCSALVVPHKKDIPLSLNRQTVRDPEYAVEKGASRFRSSANDFLMFSSGHYSVVVFPDIDFAINEIFELPDILSVKSS